MRVKRLLYRRTRNVYQRVFNREHYEARQMLRAMFRPFVERGDLVFDLGAHRGHYAEMFRELGADVVAIEPNPVLAEEIRQHFPGITVEEVAVGAEDGQAVLYLGVDNQHSTISEEWASDHVERWSGHRMVRVTTLDALVERHGTPKFVKIDVEAHETSVIRGLSHKIEAMAFEFQCAALDPEPLELLRDYEFAISTEPFVMSAWETGETTWKRMQAFAKAEPTASGDVFARLRRLHM